MHNQIQEVLDYGKFTISGLKRNSNFSIIGNSLNPRYLGKCQCHSKGFLDYHDFNYLGIFLNTLSTPCAVSNLWSLFYQLGQNLKEGLNMLAKV